MARGNTYTCATCGKEYTYCPKCAITEPSYDAERYCCKNHADIFAILSKHGCYLATAEETLEALKGYDTTGVTESIQTHIDSLKAEVKPTEEKSEVKSDEVKTESKKAVETNKKFSFRTQE